MRRLWMNLGLMSSGIPYEYRSPRTFLGLPLVHVITGPRRRGQPWRWLAVGYAALGGMARGYYAAGGSPKGKFILSDHQEDPEAVQFFNETLPSLFGLDWLF